MTHDPERFVDGGDEGAEGGDMTALRELLGAARRDLPDAGRMEAIFAKLPPVGPAGGGGGAPAGGATTPVVAKGMASAASKWAVAALVGAGAVGTGYVWTRPLAPAERAPVASIVATTTELVASPIASASPSAEVVAPPASAAPIASAEVAPRDRPAAPSASSAVRAEIEILKEAQAALGQSPARALTLAAEHERSHPRGMLGQERDMLRIQALAALGKESDARARAEAFRARYPKSAYLQRLDAMFP